jgi:hypothetical protein
MVAIILSKKLAIVPFLPIYTNTEILVKSEITKIAGPLLACLLDA